MKKFNLKNKKGITLVALVITIIILLILAGISIASLTNSGLFENAKLAKEKSNETQQKEEGILANYENKIGKYIDGTREGIKSQVLWTNPNDSTKSFTSQDIILSSSEYDYFDVIFKFLGSEPDFCVERAYKGYSFALNAGSGYSNKYAKRSVEYIDDTTLKFNSGYWGGSTENNSACIPVKIIGYKL